MKQKKTGRKIYSKDGIIGLSILLGPPAFAYIAWRNAKGAPKETAQRMKRAAFAPLAAFVILALIDSIVFSGSIPRFIYLGVTIGLPVGFYESIFKQDVETHKEGLGEFFNPWKTLPLMLALSVAFLGVIFGASYSISKIQGDDLTFKEFIGLSLSNSFDAELYEDKRQQVITNEDEAINALNSTINATKASYLASVDKAEGLFDRNVVLTQEMLAIADIPKSFMEDVELLNEYYGLKVQQVGLSRKAELEKSPVHLQQIEAIQVNADKILKQLGS